MIQPTLGYIRVVCERVYEQLIFREEKDLTSICGFALMITLLAVFGQEAEKGHFRDSNTNVVSVFRLNRAMSNVIIITTYSKEV